MERRDGGRWRAQSTQSQLWQRSSSSQCSSLRQSTQNPMFVSQTGSSESHAWPAEHGSAHSPSAGLHRSSASHWPSVRHSTQRPEVSQNGSSWSHSEGPRHSTQAPAALQCGVPSPHSVSSSQARHNPVEASHTGTSSSQPLASEQVMTQVPAGDEQACPLGQSAASRHCTQRPASRSQCGAVAGQSTSTSQASRTLVLRTITSLVTSPHAAKAP